MRANLFPILHSTETIVQGFSDVYPATTGIVIVIFIFSIGCLPKDLLEFLSLNRLVGVNIRNDIKKLDRDFPEAGIKFGLPESLFRDENIIDLVDLAYEIMPSIPRASVSSLKKLFEMKFPSTTLDKKLCHPDGASHVDWEVWPPCKNALIYAANDALAHALLHQHLFYIRPAAFQALDTTQPALSVIDATQASPIIVTTQTTISDAAHLEDAAHFETAISDTAHLGEGQTYFNNLPLELQQELIGVSNGEEDAEQDEENVYSGDITEPEPSDKTRQTILEAAVNLIDIWAASDDREPLVLPTCLTSTDRASLHCMLEVMRLGHSSIGGEFDRCLRVTKPASWDPTIISQNSSSLVSSFNDIFSKLTFSPDWHKVAIKYDPRHWMGNLFLLCQSKSSPLFKYFCTTISDAMFTMMDGEHERVSGHLRILYKQDLAILGDKERVDKQLKRVRRKYWRTHCRYSIKPPQVTILTNMQ